MKDFALRLAPLAVALFLLSPVRAQDWSWEGYLAPGKSIEIKGINGNVQAEAGGGEVEVFADKNAWRGDPEEVWIEVVEHPAGVTICAMYPTPPGKAPNVCEPGSGGRMANENNDTKVNFLVRVPGGVHFVGRTVNGNVRAENLPANATGYTVNGDVELSMDGHGEARSVNGSIEVSLGSADWDGELQFETVNGSITLNFASPLHAEYKARTLNGSVFSDLPLQHQGRYRKNVARGTLGSGGRELRISTLNGSIEISGGR